jgi:amino acid transporter
LSEKLKIDPERVPGRQGGNSNSKSVTFEVERVMDSQEIKEGGSSESRRGVAGKGRGPGWMIGLLLLVGVVLLPVASHAYIGPGAGLSAIGTLLALIATVVVAIFGFVWFPVKRMLRNLKKAEPSQPLPTEATDPEGPAS